MGRGEQLRPEMECDFVLIMMAQRGEHDVNSWKAIIRVLEVFCNAVLVAAELHSVYIGVGHWNNFYVILLDADGATGVPNVRIKRVQLTCKDV